ncbi:MAG: hypothetical protein ACYT04_78230, partial [Nostoc sp.]
VPARPCLLLERTRFQWVFLLGISRNSANPATASVNKCGLRVWQMQGEMDTILCAMSLVTLG